MISETTTVDTSLDTERCVCNSFDEHGRRRSWRIFKE
jgi:hypothetical protein